MHKKYTIAVNALVLGSVLSLGLGGCAGGSATSASEAPASAKAEAPAAPADLTGSWKQSNSKSTDAWQAATVSANTIEVNWVTDGGDTTALYWAGSYTPATDAGGFSWTSKADSAKNDKSLMASTDPTKVFTYSAADKTISYKVTAMGVTTTVKLTKTGN